MIELADLSVRAGTFVLEGVSLYVRRGEFAVLMGQTGSGKTTLLEAICGLRHITGGRVVLDERDVTGMSPAQRGVGYVPQDLALFPSLTVRDHLALGLEVRGWSRPAVSQRVAELASWLGLEALLPRRPVGLSGGEAQRVALGRALAPHPSILLFDEPLSALDADTHAEMIALFESLRSREVITALYVTHNPREAEVLADQIVLLKDGYLRRLTADGSPKTAKLITPNGF